MLDICREGVKEMQKNGLTLKLASALCALAVVLFAALCFVLPQERVLLIALCAVFFLLLSVNVHALQRSRKQASAKALDRAA